MATKKAKKTNKASAKKLGKKRLLGVTTLTTFPPDPCGRV
jgi:hypothetical protein